MGGNSCSDECIPLTGHRPFYNLISRSITLIYFFFLSLLFFCRPPFLYEKFHRPKVAANTLSRSESWTELKPVLPFSLSRSRTCAKDLC